MPLDPMAAPRYPRLPALTDFKPGLIRGRPGFFRVGQTRSGHWWWLHPEGWPLLVKAVAGVNPSGWVEGRPRDSAYGDHVRRSISQEPGSVLATSAQRLRAWRFNALGPWSAPEWAPEEFGYTEILDLRKAGPCLHAGSVLLPDVFDPAWREGAEACARRLCAPRAGERRLLGYFTDHDLGWGQLPVDAALESSRAGPPTLLQVCLSLEPSFRAYHAAWEFVLAPRQGDLARLGQDWGLPLTHREEIRQRTQAELPLQSAGYLRDQRRFSREVARRYFSTCAEVIRAHDPNHLILGCRFDPQPASVIGAECAAPFVDVVSIEPGNDAWDRHAAGAVLSTGQPVLLTGVRWSRPAFFQTPARRESRRWTSLERMLAKGRSNLERALAQRVVVGYEWSHWADADEDLPPFGSGLVHSNGREAREHTDLLTDINNRAENLHARGL